MERGHALVDGKMGQEVFYSAWIELNGMLKLIVSQETEDPVPIDTLGAFAKMLPTA